MTKNQILKFLERKKKQLNQKEPLINQAKKTGYNQALFEMACYVCNAATDIEGKLKGGEDGK